MVAINYFKMLFPVFGEVNVSHTNHAEVNGYLLWKGQCCLRIQNYGLYLSKHPEQIIENVSA